MTRPRPGISRQNRRREVWGAGGACWLLLADQPSERGGLIRGAWQSAHLMLYSDTCVTWLGNVDLSDNNKNSRIWRRSHVYYERYYFSVLA